MKKAEIKNQREEQIPASVLIDDLASYDVARRINALKNIRQVVIALGNERTLNQLMSMLLCGTNQTIEEVVHDEDEVVIALVDRILDIGEAMGNPIHNLNLLPLYEALIQLETSSIRDKVLNAKTQANDKLEHALSLLDLKKHEDILVKFLRRVDAMEFPETRQTLCRVICQVVGAVSAPSQTELLNLYLKAATDESLTARKYAAKYSKDLVQFSRLNENLVMKIIDTLFKDKEQSNKIYLIDTLVMLAKFKQHGALQPYLNLISYQFSWRIRYELISRVRNLGEVMDRQLFRTIFLPFYTKYLNDLEAEIRSIACTQLMALCQFLEPDDIVTKILPALRSLPQDSQVYVRHALAKSLVLLCPIIGKKHTSEQILPKFLQLLKDEDSEVRLAVFQNVGQISKVLGIETLSQTTIPALQEISANKNWRIRSESVDILLYFAKGLGPDFLLNERNGKIYFELLKDRVFAVRKRAIESLRNLIDIYGTQWFEKNMVPKIVTFQKINNYLQREIFIFAVEAIAGAVSLDCLQKQLVPLLLTMTSDPVENIRYNSAKTLGVVAKFLKDLEPIRRTIKPLKEDKDIDVRTIAAKVERQL